MYEEEIPYFSEEEKELGWTTDSLKKKTPQDHELRHEYTRTIYDFETAANQSNWESLGKNYGDYFCEQKQDKRGKCVPLGAGKEKKSGKEFSKGPQTKVIKGKRYNVKISCKRQDWDNSKGNMPNDARGKNNQQLEIDGMDQALEATWPKTSKGFIPTILDAWKGWIGRFDSTKVEVDNCDNFNGYYPRYKDDQFSTGYTKEEMQQKGLEYCQTAVVGYDKDNNPYKCDVKDIRKGKHVTQRKDSLGRKNFWKVQCKNPEGF